MNEYEWLIVLELVIYNEIISRVELRGGLDRFDAAPKWNACNKCNV
jgi:hypothetical protein